MIGNVKNSFKYPFSNLKQWTILSILFMIGNIIIFSGLDELYFGLDILYPILESYMEIFVTLSFIISTFVLGYAISILKKSIEKSDEMPGFNVKNDFINGLKHILISLVYLIIPLLIFIGLSYLMNVTSYSFDIGTFEFVKTTVVSQTADYVETYGETVEPTLNVILTLTISFIISLVFVILNIIGLSRFAKTDSLKEAFNFKVVFEDFKEIGFKLLIGIIITCIISIILGMIFATLNLTFSFGRIISLIGYAYLTIFNYRLFGLLYNS